MAIGEPWMRPGPSPFLEELEEHMVAQGIVEADPAEDYDVPLLMWRRAWHGDDCPCARPDCQEARNE